MAWIKSAAPFLKRKLKHKGLLERLQELQTQRRSAAAFQKPEPAAQAEAQRRFIAPVVADRPLSDSEKEIRDTWLHEKARLQTRIAVAQTPNATDQERLKELTKLLVPYHTELNPFLESTKSVVPEKAREAALSVLPDPLADALRPELEFATAPIGMAAYAIPAIRALTLSGQLLGTAVGTAARVAGAPEEAATYAQLVGNIVAPSSIASLKAVPRLATDFKAAKAVGLFLENPFRVVPTTGWPEGLSSAVRAARAGSQEAYTKIVQNPEWLHAVHTRVKSLNKLIGAETGGTEMEKVYRALDRLKGNIRAGKPGEVRLLSEGDAVEILAGKFAGKPGFITKVDPTKSRVRVQIADTEEYTNLSLRSVRDLGLDAERFIEELPVVADDLLEANRQSALILGKSEEEVQGALDITADATTPSRGAGPGIESKSISNEDLDTLLAASTATDREMIEEALTLSPGQIGRLTDPQRESILELLERGGDFVGSKDLHNLRNIIGRINIENAYHREHETILRRAEDVKSQILGTTDVRTQTTLKDELTDLENQRLNIRDMMNQVQMQIRYVAARPERFQHTRTLPDIGEINEATAFGRTGKVREAAIVAARNPVTGGAIGHIDPSTIAQGDRVQSLGVVWKQRGMVLSQNAALAETMLDTAMKTTAFKVDDLGRELTTGQPLADIVENWADYAHLFGNKEDDFARLYDNLRRDVLEDMARMGYDVPKTWDEVRHVYRQVIGQGEVNFLKLGDSGTPHAGKPGTLYDRVHQTMREGQEAGDRYNTSLAKTFGWAARGLYRYAVETGLRKDLTKLGISRIQFIAADAVNSFRAARWDALWAKRMNAYSKASVGGIPHRPTFRGSSAQAVPDEITAVVDKIFAVNRRFVEGKKLSPGARKKAILSLRHEAEEIAEKFNNKYLSAKGTLDKAKLAIPLTQPASAFGRKGGDILIKSGNTLIIPNLGNKLFAADDLKTIERLWKSNTSSEWLENAAKVSDVGRFGTVVDFGVLTLHGLGAFGAETGAILSMHRGARPRFVWGRATVQFLKSFASKDAAGKYWSAQAAANREQMGRFFTHFQVASIDGVDGGDMVEAGMRGGILETIERKFIPGWVPKPFTPFSRAMNNYLNVFAWEAWRSFEPLTGNDPTKLAELGGFIRNISGKTSISRLGASRTHELVERTFGLWAPKYTRGMTAVMLDAAKAAVSPGSLNNNLALKSLAGMAAATTALLAAATLSAQAISAKGDLTKLDFDSLPGDLKDAWNPLSSKFMAMRIGKNFVGVGGAFRSNMAFMAKLTTAAWNSPGELNPLDLNERGWVNWDNPYVRFLRAKSSPVTSLGWNILSGENYLGVHLDDPKDMFSMIGGELTPFALQAFQVAEGGLRGKAGAFTTEFFGERSFPVSKTVLHHEAAEEELGDTWENLQDSFEYKEARENPDLFPETARTWKEKQKEDTAKERETTLIGNFIRDEQKNVRDPELLSWAQKVKWGTPGGGEIYREQSSRVYTKFSDNFETVAKSRGIDLDSIPEATNRLAKVRSALQALDPGQFYAESKGKIDFDAYNAERNRLFSQLPAEEQAAWEKLRFKFDDPQLVDTAKRRAKAGDLVQTWFEMPKYRGVTKEEEGYVDKLGDLASEVQGMLALRGVTKYSKAEIILAIWEANPNPVSDAVYSNALLLTKTATSHMARNPERDGLVINNPDLAVFYYFVFDNLTDELQEEWKRRYNLRNSYN